MQLKEERLVCKYFFWKIQNLIKVTILVIKKLMFALIIPFVNGHKLLQRFRDLSFIISRYKFAHLGNRIVSQ